MAAVRLRFGKGGYNVNKTCNQSLLEIGSKQGICAIQAANLSTGILSCANLTEIENGEDTDQVLQRAPSQVAGGISQDRNEPYHSLGLSKRESLLKVSRSKIVVDAKLLDTRTAPRVYLSSGHLNNSTVLGSGRTSHRRGAMIWTTTGQRMTLNAVRFESRQQNLVSRHLLGREQLTFIRAYSGSENWSDEPLYKTKTGYYDILEVAPNATHAQIKTAYYKQSFIYHPDKNAGSEHATTRFAEISEAYNVLGNTTLRKKYDRGILSQGDLTGASRSSTMDASGSTTQQQTRARHSPAMGVGSQNVFDFDKFIKSHYSEQFQRDKDFRERRAELLKKKEGGAQEWELGKMMEVAVGALVAVAVIILVSLKR